MNWKRFWSVLALGIGFVTIQGFASWFDGYFTQAQMHSRGITNGWALVEHGGVWADAFVISPVVAYIVSKYQLKYCSMRGLLIFIGVAVFLLSVGYIYQQGALTLPEAHTHGCRTTLAGWVHGVFAGTAMWVCGMFYSNSTTPPISKTDVIGISTILTPFFYLGVVKFSEHWAFDTMAMWQVVIEITALWVITGFHLRRTKNRV